MEDGKTGKKQEGSLGRAAGNTHGPWERQTCLISSLWMKLPPHLTLGCFSAFKIWLLDFPNGPVGKNPPTNARSQVRSPLGEDPTCYRAATKPVYRNH